MTTDEQQRVLDLITKRISDGAFLRSFCITRDGATKLSLDTLETAYVQGNPDDVEMGLLIGFHFGFSPAHLDVLCRLSEADWHMQHENVVLALGELIDKRSVDTLYRAALKSHAYLEYDEGRALTLKAVMALGRIEDRAAVEKLRLLAESNEPLIRKHALRQLDRRRSGEK